MSHSESLCTWWSLFFLVDDTQSTSHPGLIVRGQDICLFPLMPEEFLCSQTLNLPLGRWLGGHLSLPEGDCIAQRERLLCACMAPPGLPLGSIGCSFI